MADFNDSLPSAAPPFVPNPGVQEPSVALPAVLTSGLWGIFSVTLVTLELKDQALVMPQFLIVVLFVLMPIGLIWIIAILVRLLLHVRLEAKRLQAAFDSFHTVFSQSIRKNQDASNLAVNKKLEEVAAAQRQLQTTLNEIRSASLPTADLTPKVAKILPIKGSEQKSSLELSPRTDITAPLARADYVRALNFPENTRDKVGFASLHRALKDRKAAQLVQAAQDMLTLLSQDGVYMDDLRPDKARPELWRRFATGERGCAIAPLGGVHDRTALALVSKRLKKDPVFNDSVHHFLRLFDKTLVAFESGASDHEIAALSDTRTARAFMLLGRVAGTFD